MKHLTIEEYDVEWEETGWKCGIKYLGFSEEASVSEVILGVMQGHVKKDMSPKENTFHEKVIKKIMFANLLHPTSLVYLGLSWTCNFIYSAEYQCISL